MVKIIALKLKKLMKIFYGTIGIGILVIMKFQCILHTLKIPTILEPTNEETKREVTNKLF